MASIIVLRIGVNVLLLMLTFVFLMAGVTKLSPLLDAGAHAELAENFKGYTSAFVLDGLIDDVTFRLGVGVAEIISAILFWTPVFLAGTFVTMFIMIGAIVVHLILDESPMVPAVLLAMLYGFSAMSINLERKKIARHANNQDRKTQ